MNRLFFFIAIFALMLFSGCLTIEEFYTFKKNGSGSMQYKVDMTQMMQAMGPLMSMGGGGENGQAPSMDDNTKPYKEMVEKLKGVQGISGVKYKEEINMPKEGKEVPADDIKYIVTIDFKFKDISSLNKALNSMITKAEDPQHTFFTKEGNTITRTHQSSNDPAVTDLFGDAEGMEEQGMTMFESMKYKIHFTFPKEVATSYVGESGSEVKVEGKKVDVEANFKDILEKGPSAMTTTVVLK